MSKISVAKAMKVKNRLSGLLNEVNGRIVNNNSVLEGQKVSYDVVSLVEKRGKLVSALIEIKTLMDQTTHNTIDRKIRLLGEKKAEVAWLKTIPTRDGTEENAYGGKNFVYQATLKDTDIDAMTKKLNVEIDDLQDELDDFNATTKIEIDESILNLAR